MDATDFLVTTNNPEMLNDTLQQMPMIAYVLGIGTPGGILMHDGYFVVRVFGDAGFFTFAMQQQGYCRVIRALDTLL